MEAVSLTISESTRAVCADESTPHLRKQFRWWFLSLQRLSFRSLFLSQLGLYALTNPSVTCWSGFVDDFWVNRGSVRCQIHASPLEADSLMILNRQRLNFPWLFLSQHRLCVVTNPRFTCRSCFVDDLWVDSDSVLLDYFSPMEELSLMIFESTGAVYATESTRHLWKRFHWWFLSRQWLSFRWLFLSQQGLFALPNPHVTFEAASLMFLESAKTQFSLTISESLGAFYADESTRHLWKQFRWLFLSQQGLCAVTNPCLTYGSSFVDDFWVCSNSVFVDYFLVNRGIVRSQIQASPVEAISLMISET